MPPTGSPGELSPNTIRVKLVKQAYGGLGFLVKQRTLKPFVLVASIVKGGVAEESGLVQIGDIILRINDIELSDMSYQSAVEVLKAVPIDTPVVLLLRGPEGYTTYLQTSFQENGQPRTVRVTKPVHESLMGRLRKTFSGSSSPISPVKGIKRLCNGEADLKNKPSDGSDMDADSTGGVESGRSSGDGDGGVIYPVVSVEEAGDGLTEDGVAIHRSMSPGYHGNGGLVGVDITGRVARFGDCNNGNDTTGHIPNGAAVKEKRKTYSAASKFAFINEGRMESEEETVLDNGAVGSPKIVLTSPKNRKDAEKMMARHEKQVPATLAQTYDHGVGRDRQRKSSTKKAIEIVQDEDEITVVVRGDVNVLSEESSTDPNSPRRFIISTNSRHSGSGGNHGNAKFNGNNNCPNGNDDTTSLGSNGTLYGNKYCNNPYGLASADPEDMVDQEAYKNYGHKNSDGSITSIGTNITISSKDQKTGNFNRVSRSGKKSQSRSSGRSSPSSAGRASPTGRTSRTSVHTSPTRGGEEELGSKRSLDKKRTSSPTLGRRKSADRRGSVNMSISSPKRFAKVKNWIDGKTQVDTLHQKVIAPVECTSERCKGSLMSKHAHRAAGVPRPVEELQLMAKDFIDQYYTSLKKFGSPAHQKRVAEIQQAIEQYRIYDLTSSELTYGAKLAWRNAPRCIGRIQWSKLQVFDARHILTARGMFEALCNHIKYATNKGNLRSAITIFPQRKEGRRDFRVWNDQLIRYAGYKMEDGSILGDPAGVELTELCVKLGWKPLYGKFDILPLILSAAGSDPEVFEIPAELVLEVNMRHPKYPWFAEMGLKWYALPAVSNMLFDCGGIEFPACPFNGWYMGSEIGARDFCDTARYNICEEVAEKMGLDTRKNTSLWKDRVLVEVNVAVLYSFQSAGVTITDHHSASESFIKHMDNEYKLRGGCPADWVWVVPPISGSLTEVFHQEMLMYKLKPSYEYQEDAAKVHVWIRDRDKSMNTDKPKRKFGFKELARAVKFSAKLMGRALARRVKCTILYATETGKSERFADTLCEIFKHAFDAEVICMSDYDVSDLEHESLVLFVSSTFGNGDPPENGESFAKNLFELKPPELTGRDDKQTFQLKTSHLRQSGSKRLVVRDSVGTLDMITGPLGNVRYSVFALGSTAYPHFAAFGRYLDQTMRELGAEAIYAVGEGDELCGQEQSFRKWAEEVFKAACDTFCLGDDVNMSEATGALNSNDLTWKPNKFRIANVENGKEPDICEALSKVHGKRIVPCIVIETTQLQSSDSDRQTILVRLNSQGAEELQYVPGDHVAVYPANNPDLVEAVLTRLHNAPQPDEIIRTEFLHEVSTPLGSNKTWTQFEKMPVCSMRTAFTHILDLTTPPSQALLQLLATLASRDIDRERLEVLAKDSTAYEDWKYDESPNMLEVLDQFPSLKIPPSLLLTQLPVLQQRYYSISSSPQMFPGEIHATIAVVRFRTKGGAGPIHEGVCSGWLNKCPPGTTVPCMVRTAPTFHLPEDRELPVIMVGPGTGIAPFRSFWQQRSIDMEMLSTPSEEDKTTVFGPLTMYFGCRSSTQDNIYSDELQEYHKKDVLTQFHVALSREPNMPKVYVQDVLLNNSATIYEEIIVKKGHFYVCGDVSMAQDVQMTLETIVQQQGKMDAEKANELVTALRDTDHIHEDIFGVGVRRPGELHVRPKDQSQRALQYLNSTSKPFKPDAVKEKAVPITPTKRKSVSKPRAPIKNIFVKQKVNPESTP